MDNTTPPQSRQKPPVKGSWEALLQEAQTHARNFNDQAIPAYQRIVDGLLALPPAARKAGNKRLYYILVTAGLELQGFLNTRDRYDEALGTLARMKPVLEDNDREQVESLERDILLLAGRTDEVVQQLREATDAEDAEMGDWGQIVMAFVRARQPADAIPVLDEMDAKLQEKIDAGTISEDEQQNDRAYITGLRAVATLEAGDIDKGTELFDQVLELGGGYAQNPHLLYGRLVHHGRYQEALPYIDHDKQRPVRAAFWRGVAQRHLGNEEKARLAFNAATENNALEQDRQSMVEFILAVYYLGDPGASGLEVVLRSLREQRAPSWILFYLSAVGWALRGDMGAARNNIQLAATQYKWTAEGHKLPYQYWFFVTDILPEEQSATLAKYFDTRAEGTAENTNDASAEVTLEEPDDGAQVTNSAEQDTDD